MVVALTPGGVGVRVGYGSGVICPRGITPGPRVHGPPVGNGARAAPDRGIPGARGWPLPALSRRSEGIAALFVYGFEHLRTVPVSGSR